MVRRCADAMCNIGNENGTDPFGRPCPKGGYCCYCSSPHHGGSTAPCNATVGMEVLYDKWGPSNQTHPCWRDYDCWSRRTGEKLLSRARPGYWYSPLDLGDCSAHPLNNCTWRLRSVDKIVNATCHTNSFFGAVKAASPSELFANCSAAVNATDPCWVRGFYQAVMGPDAGTPCTETHLPYPPWHVYNCTYSIGGLPVKDLVHYWTAPFESDDPSVGGCPALPVPPDAKASVEAQLKAAADRRSAADASAPPLLSPRQRRWQQFSQGWF